MTMLAVQSLPYAASVVTAGLSAASNARKPEPSSVSASPPMPTPPEPEPMAKAA